MTKTDFSDNSQNDRITKRNSSDDSSQPCRARHTRILESIKQQLMDLVVTKNYSLKNAAKYLKMSYSTAKKIHSKQKRIAKAEKEILRSIHSSFKIQSSFKSLDEISHKIVCISTVGGRNFGNLLLQKNL